MKPAQLTVTVCVLGASRRGTALLHSSSNPLPCGSRRLAIGRKPILIVSEVLLAASVRTSVCLPKPWICALRFKLSSIYDVIGPLPELSRNTSARCAASALGGGAGSGRATQLVHQTKFYKYQITIAIDLSKRRVADTDPSTSLLNKLACYVV
ncbi:hypothetical protein UY3_03153 [Chelonia mydas]|uniref:Uncharacterized protein n=1 Tax=Chelonia mydas TaxID=8469 RepID=M7CFA2_CHEMY|nr:hypothetical protein UY3_03153 [Chelonia mydas]